MVDAPAVTTASRVEYRCARCDRCADRVRDTETGLWLGVNINATSGLCRICDSRAHDAVRQLPADYAELSMLLAPTGSAGGTPVSGTRDLKVPIRLGVEALMAELDAEVSWWAESLMDALGVADFLWWDGIQVKRPGPRIQHGVFLLLKYWDDLLQLPLQVHVVHDDGNIEFLERDGLDAAGVLLNLHDRVRIIAGRTDHVTRLPAPCPECQATALVRVTGAENITCRRCSTILRPQEYASLVNVLVAIEWQAAA